MKITSTFGDITKQELSVIIVNLFEGIHQPSGATGAVDRALNGIITNLIADGEIRGTKGEMTLVHTLGTMPSPRILIAGLGKQERLSKEVIRQVMGTAARYIRKLGVQNAGTIAHGAGIGGIDPASSGQAIAEGVLLGSYTFKHYLSSEEPNQKRELEELQIVDQEKSKIAPLQQGINIGRVLAEATSIARDLGNEPANVLSPTEMANRAHQISVDAGLGFQVIERTQMLEMGMGALLAVAAGSNQPPKLIVMEYHGDPENESNNIALCGKGITFDSGGISIKPAAGMGAMKGDMSGGGAVIGAMSAIAQLKPKINVIGVVPATENMSGGSATRPADVVKAMTGKSIEIDNTDAEGRLILADAIGYARNRGQKRLVDIATLTGAARIALGTVASAVLGNNQALINRVIDAGETAGERIWQLPLFEEYREQIKSTVADIKNTGGQGAGAITAAYFIAEFAEEVPWAHLDIAGTARTDKNSGYLTSGSTGVGVRTLVNLVMSLAENPES